MTDQDLTGQTPLPVDTVGAFVGAPVLLASGRSRGALRGATFAVKDLIDVAETRTGAGCHARASVPVAARNAPAVDRLVAAGASLVGKTVTDEMAYSLSGTNGPDATPRNVNAPGRVSGGSSSGSAAAVAAGLVDLAVGTDTGGSVRVPASYCGVLGWRPTHGRVPTDRMVPLAPSFDTVGILARDPAVLRNGARALLGSVDSSVPTAPWERVVLAPEALSEAAPEVSEAVQDAARSLASSLGVDLEVVPLGFGLDAASRTFRTLQGREAWSAHGKWIRAVQPRFGPGVAARFDMASQITDAEVAAAMMHRRELDIAIAAAVPPGTLLVMPATPSPAPPLDAGGDEAAHADTRRRLLCLTSVAGLGRLPVLVAPLGGNLRLPVGVAVSAAPGLDEALLDLTEPLASAARPAVPGASK